MDHRVKPGGDERKAATSRELADIRQLPAPYATGSTLPDAAERMIASVAATPWIA
jgi:hypothetical protein